MKKNIAMRIAAFLFILTMISTCAFATTFAKYTTSRTATDEARVAKFGVTVTGVSDTTSTTQNLFLTSYDGTVESSDATTDVIAPGTNGTFTRFTIDGTPEVDVTVTYAATLTLSGWTVDGTEYCPIVVMVGTTECKGNTMEELKTAVEAAVASKGATYQANNAVQDTLEITWAWAFETGSTDAEKKANNIKDTALGDWARLGNDAPTISLSITCTVTQID